MWWIELRCDVRAQGCYSSVNDGPMSASSNQQASVLAGMRRLKDHAQHDGWSFGGGRWACPNCALKQLQPAIPVKEPVAADRVPARVHVAAKDRHGNQVRHSFDRVRARSTAQRKNQKQA